MNFQGKRKGKKNWTRWHSSNTQHTEFYKLLHNSTNSTLSHYTLNNIKFVLEQPNCNPPPPSHPDTLTDPQKKKMFPWTSLLLFVFCFLVFIFLSYLALSVTKHTIETPLLISYTCIALYSLHTLPCLLQSIPGGTPPLTSYIAPSWHRTLLDQLCLKLQYQKKKKCKFMSY